MSNEQKPDLFAGQIPLMKPWLGEEEAQAVREVILSGWVSLGPKTAEFEQAIASLCQAKAGAATNAATTALHLGLRALGVKAGDEVILPSFTCMANANAVLMAGAVPVFADIERRSYNLSADSVAERVTPRTRAIMVVDQIGLPADLDAFRPIAAKHQLALIDDAATALGARYKGKPLGGHGVPTAFSFHPRKMITTGEGGMLVGDDERLIEHARTLRSTGASVSDLVRHQARGAILQQYFEYGYNYRMTDMQAAMGLVQLKKLPEMLRQRHAQAAFYDEAFSAMDEVEPPFVPPYAEHAYSSYCIRLRPSAKLSASELVKSLSAERISCRHGIAPLHHEPFFEAQMGKLVFPETEAAAKETLFLPIFPGLTRPEQEAVVAGVKRGLARG